MHTSHRRSMPVKRMYANTSLRIPNLQRPIRTPAYNNRIGHLRRPHAPRMSHQRPQTLASRGRPDFKRIIIRAANNTIAAKLKASDHVIVVPLQHLRRPDRLIPPVHFNRMLAHVGRLPRRRGTRRLQRATTSAFRHVVNASLTALLLPEEIVLGEEAPTAASLCGSQ